MLRRLAAATALTVAAMLALAPAAGAALVDVPATEATTTTESELPGTTLEAEERDDGTTSAAPWLIGSGLAAAAAVGIGGTILKRRAD